MRRRQLRSASMSRLVNRGTVDADRQRFVDDAHRVELLEIVDRKRADAAAAIHFGFDQPLALQHADRLAERAAADAELAGELHLRERFARRERAVENGLAQAGVDRPRHVAGLAAARFRFRSRAFCRGACRRRRQADRSKRSSDWNSPADAKAPERMSGREYIKGVAGAQSPYKVLTLMAVRRRLVTGNPGVRCR